MDNPITPQSNFALTAVFVTDARWLIASVNRAAEKLTGHSADELIGKSAQKIFCSNKDFTALAALCKPARQGHVVSNQPILICSDNPQTRRSVLASIIPLPGLNDQLTSGAIICLQDTDSQPLIQQLALDSVAEGVFTVDESWKITSFNRAAELLTGWS